MSELEEKLNTLVYFLQNYKEKKIIVFFLTCDCVDFFWKSLNLIPQLQNSQIYSLHGKVPQKNRTDIYSKFSKTSSGVFSFFFFSNFYILSKKKVLLTTDVASRGLDFKDIDWILQYDAPQNPNAFIHRIGNRKNLFFPKF